ncbi:hypothetical protein [Sphingomonas abietis]|uniref:Uncharacterized protein n=1 Tax=Sphingomonas abietis TaxID=3012344 RepID=A0ABY7NQJ4_9SPHN|nr:hypothetical protein [Sphingomonas abietis]WBO23658.1 hypothetical protein PBT88_05925 [Sphingomonas abietis]
MALAALIAAVREADDGSGLVGTLAVAGRTLLERQARLAALAGCEHVVLLVERLPAGLTGAIDRLRRDGITIDVARSAGDAADRFHPDERVLVFADGAVAGSGAIARLVGGTAPALLTISEGGPPGPFERIDAATRWGGLALVSGDMLRKTVAMLGDWDLHSTLLRRAVGGSARRVDIADGAGLADAFPAMLVRSRAGARAATEASFSVDRAGEGWPARLLYGAIARLVAGVILDRPIESRWLRWAGIAAALLAVPALFKGWLLAGLVLIILGALLDSTGRLLAGLRLSPAAPDDRLALARAAAMGIGLLGFAWHRMEGSATPLVLGAGTVAIMIAMARERWALRRLGGLSAPLWVADVDALALLFVPFALVTQTMAGLTALGLYAAASFAIVQHRLVAFAGSRLNRNA